MAMQQYPALQNQRAVARQQLCLKMEISLWQRDRVKVVTCHSRDISLRGAFLTTTELGFPKFRTLEVRIPFLPDMGIHKPRILARAVRKTDNGIAIEFRRAHNTTLHALQELLTSQRG